MVGVNSEPIGNGGGAGLMKWIFVMGVVLALIGVGMWCLSAEHAATQHGSTLTFAIRETCEKFPLVERTRSIDGRKAIGCMYEEGKFGVSIYEEDETYVTSFPNKAKTLEDLLRYLFRRGYQP